MNSSQYSLVMAAKSYADQAIFLRILKENDGNLNINACDKEGRTALHYIFGFHRTKLAILLLTVGANPNICDHEGKTAWDFAHFNPQERQALFHSLDLSLDSNLIIDPLFTATISEFCNDLHRKTERAMDLSRALKNQSAELTIAHALHINYSIQPEDRQDSVFFNELTAFHLEFSILHPYFK